MARKARRPLAEFAVYLAVRLAVALVHALPPRLALRLADAVAWLAYRVDKRHRAVAAENIGHAFPLLTPVAVDDMVRATYRHFARMAVEMVVLPRRLHITSWRRYVNMDPWAPGLPGVLSPRPVLLVTAHFGNWEASGYMIGLTGLKTHAIARVLENPHLERFLKRLRQGTGQTLVAKKDDFDRLNAVMAGGGKLATLADQDAGPKGLFVDFFGRPASTHKAVALMALEYDAPLVVFGVPRTPPPPGVPAAVEGMFFTQVTEDVIDPRDYAGRPDAVRAITERYTAALERLIRRYPEQYFWLHRRWKTRPAVRKAKAAA